MTTASPASSVEFAPSPKTVWLVLIAFWLSSWLGTCLGGSLFGVFAGPPGVVIGFFLAAIVGAPIHVAAFLLTWVGPLVRFRFLVAMLAGCLTGVFSAKSAGMTGQIAMPIAGVVGAVATVAVLHWIVSKTWLHRYRTTIVPPTYQFSVRDAFIFLTIAAMISAAAVYAPSLWAA